MSYKHNNLMAMRQNYWNDTDSSQVNLEKTELTKMLTEYGIFEHPSLEDTKYFFFSLPSIIIVKGYALGFSHDSVKEMITQFIEQNKMLLKQRSELKIAYRM